MNTSLIEFAEKYPLKKYTKGQSIILPGDENKFVYLIIEGHVKSYAIDENGNAIILNIYKPGNIFPISEVLAEKVNPFYFEVIDSCILRVVPTKDMINYLIDNKDALFDLTRRLSVGLEAFMIRTLYLIRSNAAQKIAAALVMLAKRFGVQDNGGKTLVISLPQTHDDIASLAGVSRETASIEIKKLEKLGVLSRKNKKTIIKDYTKLCENSLIYYRNEHLPYTF